MATWTVELDEAILLVTAKGRYHVLLFYLLCILASVPTAFLAFSQVFISATPDHWCTAPPTLSTMNLTAEELKTMTIPYHLKSDGEKIYEQCFMYDLDLIANPGYLKGRSESHIEKGIAEIVQVSVEELKKQVSVENLDSLKIKIGNFTWKKIKCKYGWTYDHQTYDRTLVTDLNLVCDLSWWPRTSTTLFWVGSVFGNIVFGWISDRWGRRPAIFVMITVEVPLAIITSFSKDYTTYTVLRVIGGLFFPAMYQIPFILALELMPPKRRTYTGMVIGMLFASAMCLLALLSYALRDWFFLSLATTVPFILLFSFYWIIPESPRWLVSRGRVWEAEKVLRTIARANGISVSSGFLHKMHEQSKAGCNQIFSLITEEINATENSPALINGHAVTCIETPPKDDFITNRKIDHMQSFRPDLSLIPKKEVVTAIVEDQERRDFHKCEKILALQVAEIVKRKSRNQLHKGLGSVDLEIKNVNEISADTKSKTEDNILSGDKEESQNFEEDEEFENRVFVTDCVLKKVQVPEKEIEDIRSRVLQKSTQTDPCVNDSDNNFRRKSLHFVNRLLLCEDFQTKMDEEDNGRMDEEYSEGDGEATPMDILRNPNIRKKFFLLTFVWIANAVVYNSLSYNVSNLGVSDYLAFFIGGAVELPSYFLAWKLMDHFGRRWVLSLTMAAGGLACLCSMFIPEDEVWVTVSLAMTAKFCVSASFAVFYVFVGELLPTVLRSQAMGSASFLAGLALLACPYIVHLAVYSRVLPLVLMGVLSVVGAAAAVFLPETLHAPLPQTVREGEDFGKDFQIFSCPVRQNWRQSLNEL